MAKRTGNSSVNSSIRQGTASSNEGFSQLLDAQKQANQSLKTIENVMSAIKTTELLSLLETKKIDDENAREVKTGDESLKLQKEQLKTEQQMAKSLKDSHEIQDEEAKAIANLAKGIASLKTTGDRISDFGKKMKDALSPSSMKIGLLSKMNIGGIFSKSIDREKFIKQQRAAGSTDDRGALKEKFEGAYKTSKQMQKVDKEYEDTRKAAGMSDAAFSKTAKGKALGDQRKGLAEEHSKYDIRSAFVKSADDDNKSPTQKHADEGQAEEASIEQAKMVGEQTTLLTKIEENTRGASPDQKAAPKEESSGGMLSGLLSGTGKALDGLKKFGVGLILVAGALWVASKAFTSFGEVAWEDVGKGLVALGGLVLAALALDKVKGNVISGAVALGVLSLALWGVSAAFSTFADLEWETIGKGLLAVAGIGALGAILGLAAPLLISGGVALGALGAGLWIVGEAMQAVGQGFKDMTDGIERLATLDGSNLLTVAAGIGALGIAMAAFGAGQAAAGLGNLVSRFLTIGTDSPIEQLIKIGASGEGVEKAGIGMEKLSAGMAAFNKVDAKSLDSLNKFPWEQATKFAAAGGSLSVDGGRVSSASKGNADEAATADGKKGGNATVVNAPVNNVSKNTQVIKPQIRNQESSQASYNRQRYGSI